MRIQTAIVSCYLAFFSFNGFGEDLPKQIQQQIDSMIYAELDNHAFPGAAFICGNADTILYAGLSLAALKFIRQRVTLTVL